MSEDLHMRSIIPALLLAGCGSTQTSPMTRETGAPPAAMQAESMRGPAAGPSGRVLVLTASCGSPRRDCRHTWAPSVDQIVLGALEFRGFDTIDPQSLRKDERKRDEKIEEANSRNESTSSSTSDSSGGGVGFIGIIPVGGAGASSNASSSHSLTVSYSRHKTVILQGASFEDLRLEDKQALMKLAGAQTVATARVIVGANYGAWTIAQNVEVVIKLADAATGEMRWSTRCMASSEDHSSAELAIEHAARCATSAFPLNQ
jgi:hypothetical protein